MVYQTQACPPCLGLQHATSSVAYRVQLAMEVRSRTATGPSLRRGANTAAFSSMLSSPKKFTCMQPCFAAWSNLHADHTIPSTFNNQQCWQLKLQGTAVSLMLLPLELSQPQQSRMTQGSGSGITAGNTAWHRCQAMWSVP